MGNELTTKELYEQLLNKKDLHSFPELDGEVLIWKLYKNAYIKAFCGDSDTCIEIIGTSILYPSMHWHPNEENIFDELCLLGKKGNIMVLKSFLMETSVFYLGEPEKYRFDKKRKWYWGKLSYFEQK